MAEVTRVALSRESARECGNTVDNRAETVFTKDMTTYQVTTEADTRSKSRATRTWSITAATIDEACDEARERHSRIMNWNCGIWCSIEGFERNARSGQWEQVA